MSIINKADDIDLIRKDFDQSNYELLYLFDYNADDSIAGSLKENNIPLIDTKITYAKNKFTQNINNKTTIIDKLSDKLIDLGLQSGIYSRFYRDERLRKFFVPMYAKQIAFFARS